jgi:mannosyltransferase
VQPRETGLLVDPGDTGELAAALIEVAESAEVRAEMGERGRERACSTFSLERMVSRTLAVYHEAL